MSNSLTTLLKTPYPFKLPRWSVISTVSLFIGVFILLFQPFGLQLLEREHKALWLLGYGGVTFVVLSITLVLIPALFPKIFKEDHWKVYKEMIWLTVIITAIAMGNYLYSVWADIFPWSGLKGLLIFWGFTVPIGLFPAVIITFIQQNIYLRKNLKLSDQINQDLKDYPHQREVSEGKLILESGIKTHGFLFHEILCIQSEGNYVKITTVNGEESKSHLLRSTLKKVEEQLDVHYLFKCHRAFILNLNEVEEVLGNSQGYTVKMKNYSELIPVSRSYTKVFKEAMMKH